MTKIFIDKRGNYDIIPSFKISYKNESIKTREPPPGLPLRIMTPIKNYLSEPDIHTFPS